MHFTEAKSILSAKNGMNIYRGCTHGCIYCDSRSVCYNMEHDFEDINVKSNAAKLLEEALKRKKKKCMIGTGSMCDPYMPAEKKLCLTGKCVELIERYGFGLSVLTKSDLILRDIDLLESINDKAKCVVQTTFTTYDEALCSVIEPKVTATAGRYKMLNEFRERHIPGVVWLCPILPFINDTKENLNGLLEYCADAKVYGIICFGMGLTLREGNREYFYSKLDEHFPGIKQKYIAAYGNSYEITSRNNAYLMRILKDFCAKYNIVCDNRKLFEYMNSYEDRLSANQISMFD